MEYGIQTLPSSVVSAPSSKHNHVTEAPPPVEDHGYKMINRVKQEPDEHNKLSTSSIAECREGINIGEYNLIYLVIVEEKDSHDNDMHGLSHLSQHVNDADLPNSVVVPKCLEISTADQQCSLSISLFIDLKNSQQFSFPESAIM